MATNSSTLPLAMARSLSGYSESGPTDFQAILEFGHSIKELYRLLMNDDGLSTGDSEVLQEFFGDNITWDSYGELAYLLECKYCNMLLAKLRAVKEAKGRVSLKGEIPEDKTSDED